MAGQRTGRYVYAPTLCGISLSQHAVICRLYMPSVTTCRPAVIFAAAFRHYRMDMEHRACLAYHRNVCSPLRSVYLPAATFVRRAFALSPIRILPPPSFV
jgi:hypothetical protein